METQELHRGRLIDHLQLVVRDLEASRRFYRAVLDVLGVPIGGNGEGYFWADELFVSTADSVAARGELTGRHHLAFQARDAAMVDAFHRAALASGGTDNGAPGPRPYHPGYYAAFVLDPDGNNIEAVYHAPRPMASCSGRDSHPNRLAGLAPVSQNATARTIAARPYAGNLPVTCPPSVDSADPRRQQRI